MNPLRAWNAFWFAPTSARPLGAFRVAFGLILLAHLAFLAGDLDHWLTDAGLLKGSEARELAGPFRPSPLQYFQDPSTVRAWMACTAAAALAWTLGWRTRATGVLAYLGLLGIHHRNISTTSGADVLLVCTAFCLMLSPCGAAFSLDARRAARRRETPAEPLIEPWAQRLIQVQLSLVYFTTAILKCNGSTWFDGSAMHYVLQNPEVGRFDLRALLEYPALLNLMTHAALAAEFGLAFGLWFKATRSWAILAGVGLHAAILPVVNIPIFGELMMATYLVFLSPSEFDGLTRRLDPRRWFGRQVVAAPAAEAPPSPSIFRGPHRPVGRPAAAEPVEVPEAVEA